MAARSKRAISVLLILILALSLSSCREKKQTVSSDGEMLFMSQDEIDRKGWEGFFVLNKDGTYTPVMDAAEGYAGRISDNTSIYTRYLWFHNNKVNISDLIPTVSPKTPLVAIYGSDGNMPSEYTLEKYDYKGYTIGCHIYKDEDDTMLIETEDTLTGSSAGDVLKNYDDQENYIISKINDSDKLPLKNVDNNMQILLGLEKDKYYEFSFYSGTKFETVRLTADTLILQSEDLFVLKNPYTRTTDGYFTINLPDNLEAGYYYICDVGLFRYQP